MTELLLTIPDVWWLTSNQRLHWAAKAKRVAQVRQLAGWEATRARRDDGLGPFERVHVCAWIGYPTRAKADPSNSAPTVKAVLDGLTDGRMWADDDSEHVVAVEYRRDPQHSERGFHTVRLTLTDQAVPFAPNQGLGGPVAASQPVPAPEPHSRNSVPSRGRTRARGGAS